MSDKQPKSIKTFSNNTKKFLLNAIALFIVVTFTFYVESVGDEYENRQKYLDISKKILNKHTFEIRTREFEHLITNNI